MTVPAGCDDHLWSIILAGGNGERLQPLVRRWLGHPKPKQYCSFVGSRSMLQHTWDRADRLGAPERKVTVVSRQHCQEALAQLGDRAGTLAVQPANRDTAAGIYLPLTYLRARDPNATVVLYPSDHFVYPEERFVDAVRHAVLALELLKDRVVLIGVPPDRPEPEYGWILPGPQLGTYGGFPLQAVSAFIEKPDLPQLQAALASGGYWNTLVTVAKLKTLWQAGWDCFPDLMTQFDRLQEAIGTSWEVAMLESVYHTMPRYNFSTDLLERLSERIAALEMDGVLWSDWGRVDRIVHTLRRIGKTPVFPVELGLAVGERKISSANGVGWRTALHSHAAPWRNRA
ncbi:MAG: sugar phosphate nucleotidyltransferase [Nitrospirales bacterium]